MLSHANYFSNHLLTPCYHLAIFLIFEYKILWISNFQNFFLLCYHCQIFVSFSSLLILLRFLVGHGIEIFKHLKNFQSFVFSSDISVCYKTPERIKNMQVSDQRSLGILGEVTHDNMWCSNWTAFIILRTNFFEEQINTKNWGYSYWTIWYYMD